jgi:hypothetical protein
VSQALALAHYTAMSQEAAQMPLRCVECGGPAFSCKCVTFAACKHCNRPGYCQALSTCAMRFCAREDRFDRALGKWIAKRAR